MTAKKLEYKGIHLKIPQNILEDPNSWWEKPLIGLKKVLGRREQDMQHMVKGDSDVEAQTIDGFISLPRYFKEPLMQPAKGL